MKKGFHAGNIILIGFGVMVLFMSWLVYQCTQNPSIMVSQNYYEQELKYQDIIDAKTNASQLTDTLSMKKGIDEITILIPTSLNQNVKDASLQLYSKFDDQKDKLISLKPNKTGLYTLSTKGWGNSNYTLKLSIQTVDKKYYKEFNY